MAKVPVWFPILAFVVLLIATIAWIHVGEGPLDTSPGQSGDDVYFENIAWNLSLDNGVRFDFSDEDWRSPYVESNESGRTSVSCFLLV